MGAGLGLVAHRGDYVGWAPLPPASNVIYEAARSPVRSMSYSISGRSITTSATCATSVNRSSAAGFSLPRNVTIINQTINVTNITYNNSTVYNYGPNYNRLNQYLGPPIQRLTLQRETTGNLGQGGKRGNFNRVNGNQLTVVAPAIEKSRQTNRAETGQGESRNPRSNADGRGVQNRKQLQDEMKKENAKNVRLAELPAAEGPQT